jgi:predicted N-formylglutamate amidohydrolase
MVNAGQDAGTGAWSPFEVLNAEGPEPLLLLCDNASRLIPSDLDSLGLDEALRAVVDYLIEETNRPS